MPNDDPTFWARLGRLYGSVILKPDAKPNPEQTARLNDVFEKAAAKGQDDAAVLKEVGDYFASTQQIKEALPFYLRVLELQPDDASVREKLATGFVLTNQRARAVETLEAIIQEHPEKYQSYELLAQLHDDEGASWLVLIKPIRQMPSSRRRRRTTNKACLLIQITRRRICGWRNYCSFRETERTRRFSFNRRAPALSRMPPIRLLPCDCTKRIEKGEGRGDHVRRSAQRSAECRG